MKEFDVNGVIVDDDNADVYEWFDMACTSPKMLKEFLADADGDDVTININSGGGELYAGVNMHDQLKMYTGAVEIHIMGLAASAASIIAMAGRCYMSPASQLMIHDVSCSDRSNKRGKAEMAKVLASHDKGVAAVYAAKSGMSENEILKLMDEETWMDAQTAIGYKLVDGLLGAETPVLFTNAVGTMLPEPVLAKARRLIKADEKPHKCETPDGVSIEALEKTLNYRRR